VSSGKRFVVNGLISFLAILSIGFVSSGRSFGEAAADVSGLPDDLYREGVDRVIPSESGDLFVVLKNGLTVLIRESHASEVVSCRLRVKTGSIFEGEDMGAGLSHYLEHLVCGGTTASFTEEEIKERLRSIGGAANAYTSYDETVYFIDTTDSHYREALRLLFSYVTECEFNEGEYARERNVILQEFQMGDNDPAKQLWYSFVETAYRRHPVRYPVIGHRDRFRKIDRNKLLAYYDRWYVPENMVLAIVGNVEKRAALKAVIDLAGSVERGANPYSVLPEEPEQLSFRRVEQSLPMARLTQAMLGFRTIRLTDPDLYALDLLAVILGDGRTSPLYRSLKDERELVLSVNASSWTPYFAPGQFLVSMSLSRDKLDDAVDVVEQEISHVKEDLVGEAALERAKAKVIADHVFGSESVRSQAARLVSDWVAAGDAYFSEKYVAGIRQVSREDLRRVARRYLVRDAMTLAVVKPASASPEEKDREGIQPDETTVQKEVLPNGMTLLVKRMSHVPIVSLKFMARGGLRFEPEDRPGVSRFMAGLLTKGTQTRSKQDIARAIEDVGGSIHAGSGHNTVSVSASVLKQDFEVGLDILADCVCRPRFPEEEIEKQRRETLLAIKRLDEKWTTEVTRLFKRHYYRKHPYRNDLLGTAEAVSAFTRKDITDFYQSVVMPNNAVLAVFGDIDPDRVAAQVRAAFQEFEPGVLEQPIIESETGNISEEARFMVSNEKTSAAILMGYNGLPLDHPDRPVVDVIDAVISGIVYPGGWLHEALRGGSNSLVYYVHAYPAFGVDGAYFGILTRTTMDNFDEVVKIIRERMNRLKETPLEEETLTEAKDICVVMHKMGLETVSAQAGSVAVNEILGLGHDYDQRYPEMIDHVSAEDVLRVSSSLFAHHLLVATKPAAMDTP
jgi:zinc protease